MKLVAAVLCLGLLTVLVSEAAADLAALAAKDPLATIAALDLRRYMGFWYEIAKFPNRFQKKCVGQTRADYSVMSDGRCRWRTVAGWEMAR